MFVQNGQSGTHGRNAQPRALGDHSQGPGHAGELQQTLPWFLLIVKGSTGTPQRHRTATQRHVLSQVSLLDATLTVIGNLQYHAMVF